MNGLAALLIIGIQGIYDIRSLHVPHKILLFGITVSFLYVGYAFSKGNTDGRQIVMGWIPAIFFLTMAFVSRNRMGYADGIALGIIGNFLGNVLAWKILILALVFGGIYSISGILRKRITWESRYPFLPFLSLAIAIELFLEKVGVEYGSIMWK